MVGHRVFEISSLCNLTLPFNKGTTSHAKTLAHHVVKITSGATPGMTHGNIVVLKVVFILSSVMRMVLFD